MDTLFQTPEWEEFKLSTGYQKSYRIDNLLILQKNLPFGRSMLYSPMVNNEERIMNNIFSEQVKKIGLASKAIFYRLELDIPIHNSSFVIHHSPFQKAFEEMQPEHTLLLDISGTDDEILAQMKPKGRYNIKVARKNNVFVEEEDSIDQFYDLYATMARRQKITYRSRDYYQKLFDILHSKSYVKVLTAYTKVNNEERIMDNGIDKAPIASAIVSFYGGRATYLFGGSSDSHRNLMAPYLVQWTAIQEAKKRNCTEYDFFGIAPDDNPDHAWAGVTRYKKQFGGQEVNLSGSWDMVLRPLEYKLFSAAEKIRRK